MNQDLLTTENSICQRRGVRHELDHREGIVEFATASGERQSRPLINLSPRGLALELDPNLPPAQLGSTIEDVTLRVGDHSVRGNLTVRHCDHCFSRGIVCGGEFEPATALDERRLERLLAATVEEQQLLRSRHSALIRIA